MVPRTTAALTAALLLLAAGPAAAQPKTTIRFALDWAFQGPQSVLLLGGENGCYAEAGLDVRMDRGYGSGDTISKLGSGNYHMGFADFNVMLEFNVKSPASAVQAVFFMHDAAGTALISVKDKAIAKPADLKGKKLGSPPGDAARRLFPIFAKATGLELKDVEWVNTSPELREVLMAQRQLDAISGHLYTSVIGVRAANVPAADITVMKYGDYGVELLGHAILAKPAFAAANPAAVRGFLGCIVKSMRQVLKDPAPALAALKKRDPLASEAVEKDRLQLSIDCCWLTDNVKRNGVSAVEADRLARIVGSVAAAFEIAPPPAAAQYSDAYLPPRAELKLE